MGNFRNSDAGFIRFRIFGDFVLILFFYLAKAKSNRI